MKTRTNQPIYKDDGNLVDDTQLGGTKLYKHIIIFSGVDEDENEWGFKLIITSKKSTQFTLNDLDLSNIISVISFQNTEDVLDLYLININYNETLTVAFYSFNENNLNSGLVLETQLQIIDTVTPL